MIKLDLFDRKILHELDKYSNISLIQISKKLKRSKQFILYRINRMEREGLILSYNAIIDIEKIGVLTYRFYIKMRNFDKGCRELFEKYISNLKDEVFVFAVLHGKWDYALIVGVKSTQQLHVIWDNLLKRFKKNILNYNFCLYSPIYNFNKLFIEDKEVLERIYGNDPNLYKFKETDLKILQIYATNTRIPLLHIAQKLKISLDTVKNRIKKLEKEKVICGFKLGLDLTKLGYDNYRIDIYLASSSRNKEIHEFFKYHPNIYQVHYTIGGADMEIELFVKDLQHLINIMEEIKAKFSDVMDYMDYFSYSSIIRINYVSD